MFENIENIEKILDMFDILNETFKIMRENKIIHRNLKLKNILMKAGIQRFIMKIENYCSSKKMSCNSNEENTIYWAP